MRDEDVVNNAVLKIGTKFYLFDFSIFVKKEEEGEMKALQVQASKGLLSLEELPKPEVGSPTQKKTNAGIVCTPPAPHPSM